MFLQVLLTDEILEGKGSIVAVFRLQKIMSYINIHFDLVLPLLDARNGIGIMNIMV